MGLSELSFSATNVNVGKDIDKPVNPQPGDIYVATDTKMLLACYDTGVWVNANSIIRGVEADLPASPTLGMKFICTDVRRIYECLRPGEWVLTHKGNLDWANPFLENNTWFTPTSTSYALSHEVTVPSGECLQEFGVRVEYSCNGGESLKFYVAVNGKVAAIGICQRVGDYILYQRATYTVWAEGGDKIQVYTARLDYSDGGRVTGMKVYK